MMGMISCNMLKQGNTVIICPVNILKNSFDAHWYDTW